MSPTNLFFKLDPYFNGGMTEFQMQNFVINDYLTPYRKLRQAMVEMKARLENKAFMEIELEELRLFVLKAECEQQTSEDDIDRQLKGVEIKKHQYQLDRKKSLIEQMDREIGVFNSIIDELVETQFGGEEALLTAIQTAEFHTNNETEFWTKKLTRSAFSDFVNYGTLSKGVLESIECLPSKQQQQIIETAINQQLNMVSELSKLKDARLIEFD